MCKGSDFLEGGRIWKKLTLIMKGDMYIHLNPERRFSTKAHIFLTHASVKKPGPLVIIEIEGY